MKNLVNSILIYTIIIFLNSGCSPKIQYVTVETTKPITPCHSNDDLLPINYIKLNINKHIASNTNEDIKQQNILKLKDKYNKYLGIIQCYDEQIKASNESD